MVSMSVHNHWHQGMSLLGLFHEFPLLVMETACPEVFVWLLQEMIGGGIALELTMKGSFYTCSKFLSNDGDLQGDKLLETICKLSSNIVSTDENEIDVIATFGEGGPIFL
ncbi:hypothetical protein PoB_002310200 [Plakobranchus ocellatus]|uniref:Uncharacterized protein n=1 Tax=Plakobranchus ocellatus TaxID=259542 RepID=A0AAV3ZPK3_9GAST|nr:hypothetical protein PoB_002310200 [Plakobranchus ocellatus]